MTTATIRFRREKAITPERRRQAGCNRHAAYRIRRPYDSAADDRDLVTARLDPGPVFRSPEELRESPGLSREQKIDLLKRWAEDARELEVA
jgi:hypothetical protein